MGGKVAMVTALSYPDVVERLVVVDVSPHKAPGERESTDLIRAMKNLDIDSLRNRREADAVMKREVKVSGLEQDCLFTVQQICILWGLHVLVCLRCYDVVCTHCWLDRPVRGCDVMGIPLQHGFFFVLTSFDDDVIDEV